MQQTNRVRNSGLDQLRGICACSIMVMHLLQHSGAYHFEAGSYLGRMGYYGVSVFYILSGLALYDAYNDKIREDIYQVRSFFIKRFFRIYPLLWIVLLYYVVRSLLLSHEWIDPAKIILNMTGLFGFVAWDQYIGTGVWSIGNELVFYTLFPLLVFPYKLKVIPIFLYVLTCILFVYFTFVILNNHREDFWHQYTNPLNQVWYFASGVFLGKLLHQKQLPSWMPYAAGIAGAAIFFLWPANTALPDENVMGMNRVIFSAASLLIILFFYYKSFNAFPLLERALSYTGEISYGIYLIHAIALGMVILTLNLLKVPQGSYMIPFSLSIVMTFILSHLSFKYIEKKFMNYAKSITANKYRKPQ